MLTGVTGTARTRDGRALAYTRAGSGGVPVVLEAGMGASRLAMRPTFEALAEHGTVIAYDRAGLGGSTDDRCPRTLDRLAEDLEDLIEGLEVGPVILVGHSYGGLIVRRLCVSRPDLVRAVVLVDPTDETTALMRSRVVRTANASAYAVMSLLARLGLLSRLQLRGSGSALIDKATAGLEEDQRVAFAREFFSARTMRAARAELRQLAPALDSFEPATRALDVPVTVISAGRTSPRGQRILQQVLRAHEDFCRTSPQARHVLAEHSGHNVPIEAPALIADEVLQLCRSAESATSDGIGR